jgi:L-seryl-tRNA(Ser) seleniumtransferase
LQNEFRKIPGIDKLLEENQVRSLLQELNHEFVTFCLRHCVEKVRLSIKEGKKYPGDPKLIETIVSTITKFTDASLKPVINATGIVVHTNLGRAPLGMEILQEVLPALQGYCNLEFELETGLRGKRNLHCRELLKYLTGAENVAVVNNNAAAVILTLNEFARSREVIVSRGELIEIGGSFRIPDIMAASGCKMVEVGTTNKTKLSDYESAITKDTALIFKAHTSNYRIHGFTENVPVETLSSVAKKHNVPLVYDAGSGVLMKTNIPMLQDEPIVRELLACGVDLVTFSCDKLLGGPQAGVVAGKQPLIDRLEKSPMMRALRVDKSTYALLSAVCRRYVRNDFSSIPIITMLQSPPSLLKEKAEAISRDLRSAGVSCEIIKSTGQPGGGSLPGQFIESFAVKISLDNQYAERCYYDLMKQEVPVVGILRKGELLFDVLTISNDEIGMLVNALKRYFQEQAGTDGRD